MFEELARREHTGRTWTTMLGMAGQTGLIAAALLAPLLSPEALPRVQALRKAFLPSAPAPPPPRGSMVRVVATERARAPLQFSESRLWAPRAIPAKPALIDEPPLQASEIGLPGGVEGGVEGGIPGGILHGLPGAAPQPVPAPKPPAPVAREQAAVKPPAEPVRVRATSELQQAKLIHKVTPGYPALARQARISGRVELTGIIGADGRIRQLQVISGHPLLVNAAVEAVRQWVYQPTYLNGNAVEVIAPITVSFVLNQ